MRSLNEKYRGINEPTDVLTFSLQEGIVKSPDVDGNKLLGDIIISTETAQRQAHILNHSIGKEIIILLIHGLLHLIGYNHERERDNKIMRKREDELIKIIDL